MSAEISFQCPLPAGFHARPASLLSDVANRFESDVTLVNQRSGATANAKSVLAIVGADVKLNDACILRIAGKDERDAHGALKEFVEKTLPVCDEALPAAEETADQTPLPPMLKKAGVECYRGVPVSRGIGEGTVVILGGLALPEIEETKEAIDVSRERVKLDAAIAAVRNELQSKLAGPLPALEADLIKAHQSIVNDISLGNKLQELIDQKKSAAQAIVEAGRFFMDQLKASASLYIRERAIDMQDICVQLLEKLYGENYKAPQIRLTEDSIVVAENLAPRQLLSLDRTLLKGLVLAHAGTTSHVIILARSFNIPTLSGVKDAELNLSPGQRVVVDAQAGILVPTINDPVRRYYRRETQKYSARLAKLSRFLDKPAVTCDGVGLEVAANTSTPEEIAAAIGKGAQGIGLLRTEMLFMDKSAAPSEEEQFEMYK
jgi:multiphosphoryl transfer protein